MKNLITYASLYTLIVTSSLILACPHDRASIIEMTNPEQHETFLNKNEGPCVVLYYMNNCSYCQQIKPIFETLACNPAFDTITFYQANGPQLHVEQALKQVVHEFEGYPTLLFFNHSKLVDTQIGATSQKNIEKQLKNLLLQTKKIDN